MKLHLGCGKRYLEGYVNIDATALKVDLRWDKLDALPYTFGDVDEILAIHVLEHIWPQDVGPTLAHWCRLLRPGGKLIMEMPDLYKSCRNYIRAVDEGHITPSLSMAMFPIFGDNPEKNVYDCHKWGWTTETLKPVLLAAGFSKVVEKDLEWHGKRFDRDFGVIATK